MTTRTNRKQEGEGRRDRVHANTHDYQTPACELAVHNAYRTIYRLSRETNLCPSSENPLMMRHSHDWKGARNSILDCILLSNSQHCISADGQGNMGRFSRVKGGGGGLHGNPNSREHHKSPIYCSRCVNSTVHPVMPSHLSCSG